MLNGETKDNVNKLIVKKFLQVPVLTTVEKNKLKTVKGLIVYDSTLVKLQVFTTTWVSLH
jgi:hypothetical protein